MPTLLSDQRFQHAFHPYRSTSQTSRSSLPCRVHHLSPMTKSQGSSKPKTIIKSEAVLPARCDGAKQQCRTALNDSASGAAISSSLQLYGLVTRNEPSASSAVATSLPNSWRKLQSQLPHASSARFAAPTCPNGASQLPSLTENSSRVLQDGPSPAHTFLDTQARAKTTTERACSSSPPSSSSRSPVSTSPSNIQYHRDFVNYLKAWRPPVEYYARRRYQHPSLSYPSRRPSLPSLLEERITHDGHMDVVCPELAMPASPRAYRRRIFSAAPLPYTHQSLSTRGWDGESEEDLESDDDDDDDDDDDYGSDEESDSEAVTPSSSPASSQTYFLQPLVLTKIPGY